MEFIREESGFVVQDENRPRLYSETIQQLRANDDVAFQMEEAQTPDMKAPRLDFSAYETERKRKQTFNEPRGGMTVPNSEQINPLAKTSSAPPKQPFDNLTAKKQMVAEMTASNVEVSIALYCLESVKYSSLEDAF